LKACELHVELLPKVRSTAGATPRANFSSGWQASS
jgi:hypothetical protein